MFEALFQSSKLKILLNVIFSPLKLSYFRHLLDVRFCRICFYLQRATHENLMSNWKNHPSYYIYWKTRSPQKIFLTRFCKPCSLFRFFHQINSDKFFVPLQKQEKNIPIYVCKESLATQTDYKYKRNFTHYVIAW